MIRALLAFSIFGLLWVGCDTNYSDHKMSDIPRFDQAYYQAMVRNLNEQIESSPRNDQIYYRKAQILNQLNNYNSAQLSIEKAIELNHNKPNYQLLYATILHQKGNVEQALTAAQVAERSNIQSPELFALLGELYLKANQPEEAEQYLTKAIDLDQDNYRHYLLAGMVYLAHQDTITAEEYIIKSLELAPNQQAYAALVDINLYKKDYENAFKYLDLNLAQDPDNQELIYKKGRLLRLTGELGKAKTVFYDLLRHDSTHLATYDELSVLSFNTYKYDSAIFFANKALTLNQNHLQAYLNLARVYNRRGYYTASIENYKQILEKDTTHITARQELDQLYGKIAYLNRLKAEKERGENLRKINNLERPSLNKIQ
ncbi:MAG: tetratricopeptide repeat protein [Candidatus Cyclobacteriaceae bacterium M3_2C_046]